MFPTKARWITTRKKLTKIFLYFWFALYDAVHMTQKEVLQSSCKTLTIVNLLIAYWNYRKCALHTYPVGFQLLIFWNKVHQEIGLMHFFFCKQQFKSKQNRIINLHIIYIWVGDTWKQISYQILSLIIYRELNNF